MIVCPTCQGPTSSQETRTVGNYVRRRRKCRNPNCATRVTTAEVIIEDGRVLQDALVIPRRDLENTLRLLAGPLLARYGALGVVQMLEEVELKKGT